MSPRTTLVSLVVARQKQLCQRGQHADLPTTHGPYRTCHLTARFYSPSLQFNFLTAACPSLASNLPLSDSQIASLLTHAPSRSLLSHLCADWISLTKLLEFLFYAASSTRSPDSDLLCLLQDWAKQTQRLNSAPQSFFTSRFSKPYKPSLDSSLAQQIAPRTHALGASWSLSLIFKI